MYGDCRDRQRMFDELESMSPTKGGDGKGDKGRAYNRLGVKIQRESQKSFRGGEGKNDQEGVERLKSEDRESWRDRLKTVGSFYMRGEMREGAGTERKA